MVALDDAVGAFVPGPRLERPPAGQRTPVRSELRRQGPVRRRRQRNDLRQPGLGRHPPGRDRDRAGGDRSAAGGCPAGRQDQDGGTRLRPDRRERLARHSDQSAGPGPVPWRIELRVGGRGRRWPGRLCTRLRYRRFSAHPRQLLRPVRYPPEPRRGQPGRRVPAGAELRHLRLVHPRGGVACRGGRCAVARRAVRRWMARCSGSRRPGSTPSRRWRRCCARSWRNSRDCAVGLSASG